MLKRGELPPETRHSFSIPAEWINTLDPRIKERIRKETTEELTAKAKEERDKLAATLVKRLADKKVTKAEIDERLTQHDQLWKGKISATIAQKIERAHLYSFNIPNHRSSLTTAQVQAWHDFVGSEKPSTLTGEGQGGGDGGSADMVDICSEPPAKYKPLPKTPLDQQYELLKASPPAELDRLLSALDPRNSLELDMARQFLSGLAPEVLAAYPHLQNLSEIISSVAKYPRVLLKELLVPVSRKISLEDDVTYKLVTVKLYGKGVLLRGEFLGSELKGTSWFQVKKGDIIFSKIDARHGAFGLVPDFLDDAIVTPEFPAFLLSGDECHTLFLNQILTSKTFYSQINEMVSGASGRRRVEPGFLLEMTIPLPPLKIQEEIVTRKRSIQTLEKQVIVFRSEIDELVNRIWEH